MQRQCVGEETAKGNSHRRNPRFYTGHNCCRAILGYTVPCASYREYTNCIMPLLVRKRAAQGYWSTYTAGRRRRRSGSAIVYPKFLYWPQNYGTRNWEESDNLEFNYLRLTYVGERRREFEVCKTSRDCTYCLCRPPFSEAEMPNPCQAPIFPSPEQG